MGLDGKKVALYLRVSTDQQYEEGHSIDIQSERLSAFCQAKDLHPYEFYIDGGYTGSNVNRPELTKLISDIEDGLISYVVVYKLDRLSRSQKDTLYLIEDVFLKNGVNFISTQESFDTSTPLGKAMIGILSVFAQLERENIRERTRGGMQERVKDGYWPGGGKVPFGYDYDKSLGILVPNENAELVKLMYALYLQGYSTNKIAKMLGMKYERLVSQVLKRKSNTGVIEYLGEVYQGRHEAIISEELYERTMAVMRRRARTTNPESNNLLTGLLVCGKCGAKMRYLSWGKQGYKIFCYSKEKNKPHLQKDPNCSNESPWAEAIEKQVLEKVFKFSLAQAANLQEDKGEPAVMDMLEQQLDAIQRKLRRLYLLFADGGDDTLRDTIEELKGIKREIEHQMESERNLKSVSTHITSVKKEIANLSDIWDGLNIKEQRKILFEIIKSITVEDGGIEIDFAF